METYYTDNQQYTGADMTALRAIDAAIPGSVSIVGTPGANTYTLRATSVTGNTFDIAKAADGSVTRSCTRTVTNGGCPTGLSW
jgi:hypothetical protein